MSNKVYDILKYVALIGLPAISVFIGLLGETWGLPNIKEIVITINGVSVLLGSLLQASTAQYNKK